MAEVKDESQQVPYRLADSTGAVKIKSSNAGKDFSPEEISAQVLRKLVDDAAKFLNDKVCTRLALFLMNLIGVCQSLLLGDVLHEQAFASRPAFICSLTHVAQSSCLACH